MKTMLIVFVLATLAVAALGQVYAGDCKYSFAGGSTIDFSSVGTLQGTYNNQKVFFNLCEDLAKECTDGKSNICIPKSGSSMGSQDISFASYSSSNKPTNTFADGVNTILFDNGEKQCYSMGYISRKTSVQITCADANDTTFTITEGSGSCQFNLPIKLKCGGASGDGLSGGAIFLIVFFSVFAAYFIIGSIVCKFVLKKEGLLNIVPQGAFWCALPGLYIAGIKFVIGKLTSKGSNNNVDRSSDGYGATEEV